MKMFINPKLHETAGDVNHLSSAICYSPIKMPIIQAGFG